MALDLYSKIIDTEFVINVLLKGGKVETKQQVIDGGVLYKFIVEYNGIKTLLYSSTDIIQYYSYVKAFKEGVETTRELDTFKRIKDAESKGYTIDECFKRACDNWFR